jgi:hypothetical protein
MNKECWRELAALLKGEGIEFDDGLSDREVKTAENKFGFRFPPDLRAFLQTALPIGKGFYAWRYGDETRLREMLNWPLHGCLFDAERNNFWLSEWGKRPGLLSEALKIATEKKRRSSFRFTPTVTFPRNRTKWVIQFSRSIKWTSFTTASIWRTICGTNSNSQIGRNGQRKCVTSDSGIQIDFKNCVGAMINRYRAVACAASGSPTGNFQLEKRQ